MKLTWFFRSIWIENIWQKCCCFHNVIFKGEIDKSFQKWTLKRIAWKNLFFKLYVVHVWYLIINYMQFKICRGGWCANCYQRLTAINYCNKGSILDAAAVLDLRPHLQSLRKEFINFMGSNFSIVLCGWMFSWGFLKNLTKTLFKKIFKWHFLKAYTLISLRQAAPWECSEEV